MNHFVEFSGQKLRYRKFGSGPNLLLLHTLRGQSEYFDLVIPALAKHFTVISPDLPGHGLSSKSADQDYDASYFINTMRQFIEELALTELTIVGESIGATIALALGVQCSDRISAIYAFNPFDNGSIIGGTIGKIVSFVGRFTTKVASEEQVAVLRKVLSSGYVNQQQLSDDYLQLLIATVKQDPDFPLMMQSVFSSSKKLGKDQARAIPAHCEPNKNSPLFMANLTGQLKK